MIGYGTGVTVGELGALDAMRDVTVAEISPGVIDAAPLFDGGQPGRARRTRKTAIVRGDAYRALLRSDGQLRRDRLGAEQSVGDGRRDALQPGVPARRRATGCDPAASTRSGSTATRPTGASSSSCCAPTRSVFDHVAVWYTLGPDLLLLGFKDPDVARARPRAAARARFAAPRLRRGLAPRGIDAFPALLAHELLPLGVRRAAGLPGDLHTLLHPVLSHRAARAFFAAGTRELPLDADARAAGDRRAATRCCAATRARRAARSPTIGATASSSRSLQDAAEALRDALAHWIAGCDRIAGPRGDARAGCGSRRFRPPRLGRAVLAIARPVLPARSRSGPEPSAAEDAAG